MTLRRLLAGASGRRRLLAGAMTRRRLLAGAMTRRRLLAGAMTLALLGAGCGAIGGDPVLQAEPLPDAAAGADAAGRGGAAADRTGVAIDVPAPEDRPAPDGVDASSGAVGEVPPFSVVAEATSPTVVARDRPDDAAPVVADLANPTAFGSPLVLRVVDGGPSEPGWLHVQLPIEPNGTTGWIRRDVVELSNNPYRFHIDRASFSLEVFHEGRLWLSTPIAVGTGDTPTPVGEFYLTDLLQPDDPDGVYGPFAFGLSGFSEVLESFGGVDSAIIGIHGTNDPGAIGSTVSKGCVRVENAVIERLAAVVPLGTPVVIT